MNDEWCEGAHRNRGKLLAGSGTWSRRLEKPFGNRAALFWVDSEEAPEEGCDSVPCNIPSSPGWAEALVAEASPREWEGL